MDTYTEPGSDSFGELGLSQPLEQAIADVGYEAPTPIQLKVIPLLLAGKDVIGQAQTGTGKTAAFALPILERLELGRREVQALVLTPTRELAIQVAEAIHTYARHLGRVHVAPIYGGQSIQKQIGRLRGGLHVVVGTPGRIMDHLRRGTLDLAVEVLAAVFTGTGPGFGQFGRFLLWTSLGNSLGGIAFAYSIRYGLRLHGNEDRRGQRPPE